LYLGHIVPFKIDEARSQHDIQTALGQPGPCGEVCAGYRNGIAGGGNAGNCPNACI
jgi:hypothetical protein